MEVLRSFLKQDSTRGISFIKTSFRTLQYLKEKHKSKIFILSAISIGAISYISKEKCKSSQATSNEITRREFRKVAVDEVFWRRLRFLIKIIIPRMVCIETVYLILLSILLVSRTALSIRVAEIMGTNSQSLVQVNLQKFIRGVLSLGVIAIPASLVNSMLKYFTNMLHIRFRKRLSYYIHERYLDGITYYRTSLKFNLDNVDQRITQDIDRFSSAISHLYSTTFKPLVDIVLFTRKLATSVGLQGPIFMYIYYLVAGFFVHQLLPNFASMISKQQKLEGNFHSHHARLLMHAEEVAFYRGWDREKILINTSFDRLYNHSRDLLWKQTLVSIFDAWLVKYGATLIGYIVVALPVFGWAYVKVQATENRSSALITKSYIRNTQILINLAQAIGQMVLLYKRITQLAGYTARVGELLEVFDEIQAPNPEFDSHFVGDSTEGIKIIDVDISTPDEKLSLIKNLSLNVLPGENTLIMGPNGSGKSSVLRVLDNLWGVKSGKIMRPPLSEIMFIPQKAYFPIGTLRDQLIYPDRLEDCVKKGITDDYLLKILEDADLDYLVAREGGWDVIKDWIDIFSGGEKQRMNFARVFYFRPKYACLDECTSAVSVDIEGKLYEKCLKNGTTIITISHRKQLLKYHKHLLEMTDSDHYTTTDQIIEE